MLISANFGQCAVADAGVSCRRSRINAVPQAQQRLRWRQRRLASRLGVTIGAIVLAFSGAACSQLPGGDISCGQFLDEDIVSQEDIVEKALSENALSTENYADLALTTQQLRNSCSNARESLTISDILSGTVD